jgi:hypothetical protein
MHQQLKESSTKSIETWTLGARYTSCRSRTTASNGLGLPVLKGDVGYVWTTSGESVVVAMVE